jgi:hypothetical protein
MERLLTARQLQDIKTEFEIKIERLLGELNTVCADNNFQISGVNYQHNDTDHARTFEIDIQIE